MRVLHRELTEKKNYFLYRSVLILSRGRVTRPSQRWQAGGSQGDPWFERILRGMKEQLQGNIRNSALPTPAVLPVQNLPTHRNWLLIMPTVFKTEFKKQNWSENIEVIWHIPMHLDFNLTLGLQKKKQEKKLNWIELRTVEYRLTESEPWRNTKGSCTFFPCCLFSTIPFPMQTCREIGGAIL